MSSLLGSEGSAISSSVFVTLQGGTADRVVLKGPEPLAALAPCPCVRDQDMLLTQKESAAFEMNISTYWPEVILTFSSLPF